MKEMFSESLVEEIMTKGFPLKIQVPLTMSIRANVYFMSYEELDPKDDKETDKLFEIPE